MAIALEQDVEMKSFISHRKEKEGASEKLESNEMIKMKDQNNGKIVENDFIITTRIMPKER